MLQRGNTLHAGGRWESTKVELAYPILGTVAFLVTRTALHRGRLDLGVWHGQHELLFREPVELERLDLAFRLARPGALTVHTLHDGARFEAVRLSRAEAMPTACLEGTSDGGFTARDPLPDPGLDDGWHHLSLVGEAAGFRVLVDGETLGRCGRRRGETGRFGVRGSAADKTLVDDVRALTARRGTLVEDFENHRGEGRVLALSLTGLVILHALVAAAALRRRREGPPLRVYLAATHLSVGACVLLALLVDGLYLSRLHPEQIPFERYPYENRIEYEAAVTRRLAESVPLRRAEAGVRRVLLIGSSQTWGSGAATAGDTWGARLEAGLQAHAASGERFEVVNAGIPGLTGPQLARLYREQWTAWEPELVIVDLSNNDRDPEAFAAALEEITQLGAERGARTVFVPEPNSVEGRSESGLRKLAARHGVMRDVAARLGVPVVEAHAPLAARRDEGFLWWDRVHLTSFGHALLAELLLADPAVLLGPP